MSNQGDNELAAEEALVSSLYQQQATEQPPVALDFKILEQAKQQLRLTTYKQPTRSRFIPYSVAASIGLVGMLYLNFPQYYQLSQPPIIPDFEPVPILESSASDLELSEQPAALQKMKRTQHSMAPQQVKEAPAAMPSASAVTLAAKQSTQQLTSDVLTLSQSQLQQIERLLAANKKQQAIAFLQQLLKQQPNMVLATKYQALLSEDPINK